MRKPEFFVRSHGTYRLAQASAAHLVRVRVSYKANDASRFVSLGTFATPSKAKDAIAQDSRRK